MFPAVACESSGSDPGFETHVIQDYFDQPLLNLPAVLCQRSTIASTSSAGLIAPMNSWFVRSFRAGGMQSYLRVEIGPAGRRARSTG